jgi:hypothetical protein
LYSPNTWRSLTLLAVLPDNVETHVAGFQKPGVCMWTKACSDELAGNIRCAGTTAALRFIKGEMRAYMTRSYSLPSISNDIAPILPRYPKSSNRCHSNQIDSRSNAQLTTRPESPSSPTDNTSESYSAGSYSTQFHESFSLRSRIAPFSHLLVEQSLTLSSSSSRRTSVSNPIYLVRSSNAREDPRHPVQ